MVKATDGIDVCITFDTTGSMYPCLTQVRREARQTVKQLFRDIPGLRVAVIAHGDYCDEHSTYVTKALNFSSDQDRICDFIENVGPTHGGDAPECYELVLNEARQLNWQAGKAKVLVVIGDDVPHGPNYRENKKKLDWRNELGLLLEAGINVYGVHCMPGIRQHSKSFYEEIARKTGGFYLTLDQFSRITTLIKAICYKQSGDEQLHSFEAEIKSAGQMDRNMTFVFSVLFGKTPADLPKSESGLVPVPAGRFQVLYVDEAQGIQAFVKDQGCDFKKGRGFYELTKPETVQGFKEIILVDKATGDIFTGAEVREMMGLPPQTAEKSSARQDVKIKPVSFAKYRVFIQSTSWNRKLVPGTHLMYEVSDWEHSEV